MRKKITAQACDPGNVASAAGYTMNTNPGPKLIKGKPKHVSLKQQISYINFSKGSSPPQKDTFPSFYNSELVAQPHIGEVGTILIYGAILTICVSNLRNRRD